MIIHAATVELAPNELRLLQDSGLPIPACDEATVDSTAADRPLRQLLPFGRADLAGWLRQARASSQDPAGQAVIASFLKQLRV